MFNKQGRHGRHSFEGRMGHKMAKAAAFGAAIHAMRGRGFGGRGPDGGFGDAFGGFGGGGGRRGGPRRGRIVSSDELRLVLLHLIGEEPRHGYDLIRAIEDKADGQYAPSPGMVYPLLAMLDEMGLIAAEQSDGARKRFAITDAGKAELIAKADMVAALLKRLESLGESDGSTIDTAPLHRAMANLHVALRHRVKGRALTREEMLGLAELLDATAQEIERR